MEILFVSHKYPPATGGMEKQSHELINQMGELTKVHRIVYEGKESRLRFFALLGKRIRKVLKNNPSINIIHYNDGLLGVVGMIQRRHPKVKKTVTIHGLDVVFPGLIYQKLIVPKFNDFDLIFAVSHATAAACRIRGIKEEKLVVVNNGVDTLTKPQTTKAEAEHLLFQKYRVAVAGKKILVALGRPVKRKGFSWFIKNVMPLLHKDFILLLIGPVQQENDRLGILLKFLPAFISTRIELFLGYPSDERALSALLNPNTSRVLRLGKLPGADIDAILAIAEAFVMPNIEVQGDMEGFGLVCLEACMHGTKVFASASGGITDAIIHKKNGVLLPPGHITSWVHALNDLAENPAAHLSASEILSFTESRFGWQKMAKGYHLHFSRLIATIGA